MSIEWAAGLFEGEGTIVLLKNNQRIRNDVPLYDLQLALGMTDEDVVTRFCQVAGCGFVQTPAVPAGRKQMYRWVARSGPARDFMEKMLPHLGLRRTARYAEVMHEIVLNREHRNLVAPKTKFSDQQIAGMRRAYDAGIRPVQIRSIYGISEGHLTNILNGSKRPPIAPDASDDQHLQSARDAVN
jgi:hypothetical protein